MVGRAVECGGLENRCGGNSTGGSNPSPSASNILLKLLNFLTKTSGVYRMFFIGFKGANSAFVGVKIKWRKMSKKSEKALLGFEFPASRQENRASRGNSTGCSFSPRFRRFLTTILPVYIAKFIKPAQIARIDIL